MRIEYFCGIVEEHVQYDAASVDGGGALKQEVQGDMSVGMDERDAVDDWLGCLYLSSPTEEQEE